MSIRKLTLSYPILVEDRQQRSVFTVGEKQKVNGYVISSIRELLDVEGRLTYQINVNNGKEARVWKQITPTGCTVEVEFNVD